MYHMFLNILIFEISLCVNHKKKISKDKSTVCNKIHNNNDGKEKSVNLKLDGKMLLRKLLWVKVYKNSGSQY